MYRRFVVAAAVAALSVIAIAPLPAHASAAGDFKRTAVGDKASDFTLSTLDGESCSLATSLGDKATVVIFWAAWSSRSQDFLKDVEALYEKHGPDAFKAIAVNVEHPEWRPDEVHLIRQAGIDAKVAFPMVVDKDLAVYNDYGVVAVPSGLILDGQGVVKTLLSGYGSTNKEELLETVTLMVDEAAAKKASEPVAQRVRGKGMSEQLYNMARRLAGKRLYSKAVAPLQKAIAEDPDYAPTYRLLAEVYEKMHKSDEAAAAVRKAEELEAAQGIEPPAAPLLPDTGKDDKPHKSSGIIPGGRNEGSAREPV